VVILAGLTVSGLLTGLPRAPAGATEVAPAELAQAVRLEKPPRTFSIAATGDVLTEDSVVTAAAKYATTVTQPITLGSPMPGCQRPSAPVTNDTDKHES
jgi:hypothetical protein